MSPSLSLTPRVPHVKLSPRSADLSLLEQLRNMKRQGVVTMLLFAVIRLSEQQCPRSWTQMDESCYALLDQQVTWLKAREYCVAVGGHLVEIDSEDENNFILNLLKTHGATGSWIGLQDLIEEGHFLWTTTQRQAVYTNWASGEPDDLSGEDCVWITNDPGYRAGAWNDDKCETFQTHVICEQSTQR
ncbi:perlucin-like protein [Pomacea canaliculata]|uniref:perlucin-like protein n=1 Tax=Pomacea canaliculata TaxID=400727 RepID=UPI000D73B45A|nr:perlucin-like protein [Pomacea canaliculata]